MSDISNLSPATPVAPSIRPVQTEHHRFIPTELPKKAVEPRVQNAQKIAGEVSFRPVTTFQTTDNNVFVRPVKNVRPRSVISVANKTPEVKLHGERTISLPNDFHQQIKAQAAAATQKLRPAQPPPQPLNSGDIQVLNKGISPEIKPATNNNSGIKVQLDQINKVLFEQIKNRVAWEIAHQKPQVTNSTPNPNQPNKAVLGTQQNPPIPIAPVQTTQTPVIPLPTPTRVTVSPQQPENYSLHIENLEKEVAILNKEIFQLEKTIQVAKVPDTSEVNSLEKKVAVDERMLKAVADWRLTLDNLVDNHTRALKYLKAKSNWLEDKVDHNQKHNKLHKKPRSVKLETTNLSNSFSELDTIATSESKLQEETKSLFPKEVSPVVDFNLKKPSAPAPIFGPKPVEPNLTKNPVATQPVSKPISSPISATPAVIKPVVAPMPSLENKTPPKEVSKPPEKIIEQQTVMVKPDNVPVKTEVIQKPSVQMSEKEAEQIGKTPGTSPAGPVVEQQTVIIKPQAATVIEPEKSILKEVPKPVEVKEVVKPSFEAVRDLVKQALDKQAETQPDQKTPVDEDKIKSLIKEVISSYNLPEKVVEKPVQVVVQNSPNSVPSSNNTFNDPGEIERIILQKADEEEKAREETQKKIAEAKKEHIEKTQKKVVAKNQSAVIPSAADLEANFTKLKTNLTTLDPKIQLDANERQEMLKKLQGLENEGLVTKQMDELKASGERRRINEEIQKLLNKVNAPVGEPKAPSNQTDLPTAKIETLKIEEKAKATPAEKAKIIAEIKQLERDAQARKAAEAARPVVKAQPAFGKMLPNTPTIPNVINGLVKDNRGLLLSTVVIIVKDKDGEPVRAFKTNKIGQFALSTPVPNGIYTLELEKEGYDFDIIEVEVNGEIMKPIEIKAK